LVTMLGMFSMANTLLPHPISRTRLDTVSYSLALLRLSLTI
jgi:hypothetical protein